jgi:hypothetical protein
MSDNDILGLFEGLTPEQAQALRERIVPALQDLRREITNKENAMTEEEKREIERRVDEVKRQVNWSLPYKTFEEETYERDLRLWGKESADRDRELRRERLGIKPAFDASAANGRLDELAQEYERLAQRPSLNIERMREIKKELDEKTNLVESHARTQRQAALSGNAELQAINADLETLSSEYSRLAGNPSQNIQAMNKVQADIEARLARKTQIENGETPAALQWGG